MYKNKTILAVIPARAGSKRLPRKSIRPLAGKPLISWTFDAALQSKYLDEIIVSSDDQAVLDLAQQSNVRAPFVRPANLAHDQATTSDVLIHAINFLQTKEKKHYDYLILLQPTSPLRQANDIDEAIRKIIDQGAHSVVSVCEAEHHPLRSNTLPENLSMDNFLRPEAKDKMIQEMPVYYRLNGAVHIAATERFLAEKTFFFDRGTYALIMPQARSVDIDTALDFAIAELLIKEL